jgi:hypothetical protein
LLGDLGLFFFYNKEQSLYFSLLKMISLFEISFIYSKFLYENNIFCKYDIFKGIISFLTHNIINIKCNNNSNNDSNNDDSIHESFYFFHSMKILYIFLNISLFIETIMLITRPFGQSKKKAKIYYIISTLIIIMCYFLQNIISSQVLEYFYYASYGIFSLTAFVSIIFVIKRFCWKKPLIQGAKNLFVLRHIIYIIVLSVILIIELGYVTFGLSQNLINYIVNGLGFIMSIIKISDSICIRSNNKTKNKKSAVSMISSNLNVEFMCCILYGMTDIFVKNQNQISVNLLSKKKQIIHTIKYINTIDSSNVGNINEIQLHVSVQDLGNSLIPEKKKHEENKKIIKNK